METSPCHNSVAGHRIVTNPCTCHDSTAVVPCTKFCSDHCIRIEIRVKRNFHLIWIAIEKSLVKRGPVQETLTLFVLNFICETLKYICILFHFLTSRWNRSSTASLLAWKDLFILHGQYHGSWWSGSLRRQGISCYGILTMYSLNIPVSAPEGLTLKQLGHFFQSVILFSNVVHYKCNIFIWNWSNTMNVQSALWMLMAWCFSTRASVATVLTMHPYVSRCLGVKYA